MSQMLERIKKEMLSAMKSREEVRCNILKLVISESRTQEIRQNKDITDEQVLKIVGKIIENNSESLSLMSEKDDRFLKLKQENLTLSSFMPKTISFEEILSLLEGLPAIISAKSDGQATGEAIKFLKSKSVVFDNKLVAEVVKKLR